MPDDPQQCHSVFSEVSAVIAVVVCHSSIRSSWGCPTALHLIIAAVHISQHAIRSRWLPTRYVIVHTAAAAHHSHWAIFNPFYLHNPGRRDVFGEFL